MLKTHFRRGQRSSLAVAGALGVAFALSACGGGTTTPEPTTVDSAAPVLADPTCEEAAEAAGEDPADCDPGTAKNTGTAENTAGGSTVEKTEVQVGETITDPDMGDTLEVLSAVRDFPSEEQADLIADGGEVVLLEVSVTPGEEFGGLISTGNFKISWDDGDDFWGNKTRLVEDELDAAGYTVLDDVSRRDGGEHTGWMAFFVDERSDTYLMNYERRGAEVIGSDEVIDEFSQDFAIPAS